MLAPHPLRDLLLTLSLSLAASATLAEPNRPFAADRPHLQRLDTDGDGQLSRAELEAAQSRRAQAIDRDGDGLISAEELQDEQQRLRLERLQRRLARADQDGDGQVTQAEWGQARVTRLLRLDRNGDGLLAADEWPRRPAVSGPHAGQHD